MKLSYAIENIRRIQFTPDIEMRPITLLVGRNSAGKSTFLRSLPLIRQSLETRSSAPILWFGELVDFGDIGGAIPERNGVRQAALRFTIHDLQAHDHPRYFHNPAYHWSQGALHAERVSLRYVIGSEENKTVLQTIEVNIPNEHLAVSIDFQKRPGGVGQLTINGTPATFISDHYDITATNRSLFSSPIFTSRSGKAEGESSSTRSARDILVIELASIFGRQIRRKISKQTIWHETRRILSEPQLDETTIKNLMHSSTTVTFREIYEHLLSDAKTNFKQQLFTIQRLARVYAVLDTAEDQLTELLSACRLFGASQSGKRTLLPAAGVGSFRNRLQRLQSCHVSCIVDHNRVRKILKMG